MSIVLTYWEYPRIRHTGEDYDGIKSIVLKSVKDIPILVRNMPRGCKMISTERSAIRRTKNGKETKDFKRIWEYPEPIPVWEKRQKDPCPYCGSVSRGTLLVKA